MRIERRGFFPRFDDLGESQHHRISTFGTLLFGGVVAGFERSAFARMCRKAGSLFVTQWPKANPPTKTAIPARSELKRLKAPTALTQTK